MIKIKLSDIIKKQPIINIGTIGHISHGKSTVVHAIAKAYTPEAIAKPYTPKAIANSYIYKKNLEHSSEQIRNINIDYINTKIWYNKDPSINEFKTTDSNIDLDDPWILYTHLSFIDFPGQNIYLSSMINISSTIDSVLFVISGSDDTFPQFQTVEYMNKASKLKFNDILFLHNKLDLIKEEKAAKNYDQIINILKNSPYEDNTVLPISALNNINIDSVIRWLSTKKPSNLKFENNKIVFNIIKSYDMNCLPINIDEIKGGCVFGILKEGIISVGDYIEIKPGFMINGKPKKLYAKVLEIYSEKNKLDYAIPGGMIEIQLDIDSYLTKNNRLSGQIMGYNIEDYKVYQKFSLKIKPIKSDISVTLNERLIKNPKVYININSSMIEVTIDKIKDNKINITSKIPIAINEHSKISIITVVSINEMETNVDFYGYLKDGTEIQYNSKIEDEFERIYDEYEPNKYEIINDIEEKEIEIEFNYDELLKKLTFINTS
jgi:translation initiation factor 2 subunit 3